MKLYNTLAKKNICNDVDYEAQSVQYVTYSKIIKITHFSIVRPCSVDSMVDESSDEPKYTEHGLIKTKNKD